MSTPGGTDRPAFDPRHDAIYQRGYQAGDSQTAQPGAAPAGTSRAGASRIGDPPAGPGSSGAAAFGGTGAADEIGDLDPRAGNAADDQRLDLVRCHRHDYSACIN